MFRSRGGLLGKPLGLKPPAPTFTITDLGLESEVVTCRGYQCLRPVQHRGYRVAWGTNSYRTFATHAEAVAFVRAELARLTGKTTEGQP